MSTARFSRGTASDPPKSSLDRILSLVTDVRGGEGVTARAAVGGASVGRGEGVSRTMLGEGECRGEMAMASPSCDKGDDGTMTRLLCTDGFWTPKDSLEIVDAVVTGGAGAAEAMIGAGGSRT